MARRPPFGTAHREVLLNLTSSRRSQPTWSLADGTALYESRALTDMLCQGLVRQGLLDEEYDGRYSRYTVNQAGHAKAKQLRRRF